MTYCLYNSVFQGNDLYQLIIILTVYLAAVFSGQSIAETITVGQTSALAGETVSISISIDIPENIAGAAFSLTYSHYLTLNNIHSTFFDTFANQWQMLEPPPDPLPPTEVVVDEVTHNRPISYTSTAGSTLISAARVQTGAQINTLFTLEFLLAENIPEGTYPITISPTRINSEPYGYPEEGAYVPMLVGSLPDEKDLKKAYPPILAGTVSGKITVNIAIVDSDNDGIDDAWELLYFGDLTTASSVSDYDRDGYTDRQEYLNQEADVFDPEGNICNPLQHNAPGGQSYNPKDNQSFWILMMPVLMNQVSQ